MTRDEGNPTMSVPPPPPPAPPVPPPPAGQTGPPATRRRRGAAIPYLVTALVSATIAALAVLFVVGALVPPPVIDEAALEEGVLATLTSESPGTGITSVDCPAELSVVQGVEFTCSVTSHGSTFVLPLQFLDDEGSYRVGGPL